MKEQVTTLCSQRNCHSKRLLLEEAKLMGMLKCKHVISVIGLVETGNGYGMAMEYACLGSSREVFSTSEIFQHSGRFLLTAQVIFQVKFSACIL